ncbi:Ubiquitin carboxyl-terminal hydrolase 10, partial [Ascosphaera atra]
DGREWIRIDDTVIRRVRPEDVAAADSNAEENSAVAAALDAQSSRNKSPRGSGNIFENIDDAEEQSADDEIGWSQVNGAGSGGGKRSMAAAAAAAAAANGAGAGVASPATTTSAESTRTGTPSSRSAASAIKDNRVAYLLIYERVNFGAV